MGLNNKAQTEVIGLVIIVLLLSLGMLFVVLFFLRGGEEPPHEAFTREQTPYNMINAILETDSLCRGTKMRDLFKDCFVSESIKCGAQTSCKYLNERLEYIFHETLEKWKIEYEFKVVPDEKPKFFKTKSCKGERSPGIYVLPTELGRPMEIHLYICGK